MLIQYISDIHLETYSRTYDQIKLINSIKPTGDILILAGDIGNPFQPSYTWLLDYVSRNWEMSFIVAGNHECYNNTITETYNRIQEICETYDNIIFLNNTSYLYDNIMFIGTTLWSNITSKSNALTYSINDLSQIQDMSLRKYELLFKEHLHFLETSLITLRTYPIIVITHHLPLIQLIDEYYLERYSNYNQWFASDLFEIIKNSTNIKAWFYGHTHKPRKETINGINFLCNPLGYKHENENNHINKIFRIDT